MLFFVLNYLIITLIVIMLVLFVGLIFYFRNVVIFILLIDRINFCKIIIDVYLIIFIVIQSNLYEIMYFFL
jgi:hypothetical protein